MFDLEQHKTWGWQVNCSNLPLKYASRLSEQICWQKIGFILYCLNMSCRVICCKCMNFLCLKLSVSLLTFHWNISNDRYNSSYICPTSVWTSEQSNWPSMSRTMLCRASKPLKSLALSDSTNVSIGFISLQYVLLIVPNFPDGAFTDFILPRPTHACSARSACSTLQWFHIVGLRWSMLPQVSSVFHCDSSNQKV